MTLAIRAAALPDVPQLIHLEHRSFTSDRLTARSFRHLIRRGHAATLVEEEAGVIRGYAMIFFRRGSRVARLYSFAVAAEHRGKGLAKALLAAAETAAAAGGAERLRLELRGDNHAAMALYRKMGYEPFATTPGYYEDGMEAVRMEKRLGASPAVPRKMPQREI